MRCIVIFGGTGFIGTHLAQHLLSFAQLESVVLVDINPPRNAPYASKLQEALALGKAIYFKHDVRQPIPLDMLPASVDLVFNIAAVHREPGHTAHEYFETNLLGAENVCGWAASVGCKRMVFTSSISPYGPSGKQKTETALPVPETAYGGSKLVAEKIHLSWQAANSERKLLIMRPGVVFGPGECGNVTRLLRSVANGYFFYVGNRTTIKAAGYVKELCLVMSFGLHILHKTGMPVLLLNFTMDPPPTMEQIVNTIMKVLGHTRKPLSLPRGFMLGIAYPIAAIANILGIDQPISPVRVRKLFRSTNVIAERLRALDYSYTYSLESALRDWKVDCPEEFTV